jgi:cell filamentation protein
MYAAIADPYCYPGTTVLINLQGLRNQARLNAFETEVTSIRADQTLPPGHLSYSHYRAIHRHLFQDVYAWAGKIRTVRISKDGSAFCYPEHIDREMKRLFAGLRGRKYLRGLESESFAKEMAHLLAELNAIHPFREGNGRTQLSFLKILADRAGHPLSLPLTEHSAILDATLKSFGGDEKPLARLLFRLVSR